MNWDLYPQVIDSSIKNPIIHFICSLWNMWNSLNYKKIDMMLTIGEVMAKSINQGLKEPIDIKVIPISVDIEMIKPLKKENNFWALENNLEEKFVVLYSGKMGKGHNIEIILESAQILEEYRDIQFVFIGTGEKYKLVQDYINCNNASNIKLFPLQSSDIFPFSIACGDIGIVSQETEMSQFFFPSKAISMMAAGEMIIGICSENDDLNVLISKNGIGEVVTDNSADTLSKYILNAYHNPEITELVKKKSRAVCEEIYSTEQIQEAYKKLFIGMEK